MTGNRVNVVLLLLVATVFAFSIVGCGAKKEGPKDADAIKIIQAAAEADVKGGTVSPVVILEKGAKLPTGEWPFKVEYTVNAADGNAKKETVTYKLSPTVNAMGANTWLATVSK